MNIENMTVRELLEYLKDINIKHDTPMAYLYLYDDGSGGIRLAGFNPFIFFEKTNSGAIREVVEAK